MKNNFETSVKLLTEIYPINKIERCGELNERVVINYKSGLTLKFKSNDFHYEIIDENEPTEEMINQRKILQEVFDSSYKAVMFNQWNTKTSEILRKLIIYK